MEVKETIFLGQDNYKPYVIYESSDKKGIPYTVCVPKNHNGNYNIFLLTKCKSSLDSMLLRNNDLIKDDGIVIVPKFKDSLLSDAANENDDRLFGIIYRQIVNIVNECRSSFPTGDSNFIQIFIDDRDDFEFKFNGWLEINGLDKWIKRVSKPEKQKKVIPFKELKLNDTYQPKEYIPPKYTKSLKKKAGFSNGVMLAILLTCILVGVILPILLLRK